MADLEFEASFSLTWSGATRKGSARPPGNGTVPHPRWGGRLRRR